MQSPSDRNGSAVTGRARWAVGFDELRAALEARWSDVGP